MFKEKSTLLFLSQYSQSVPTSAETQTHLGSVSAEEYKQEMSPLRQEMSPVKQEVSPLRQEMIPLKQEVIPLRSLCKLLPLPW